MSALEILLRSYPASLRDEYGGEMRQHVRDLRARVEYRGGAGSLRLGVFLLSDVVRTIARERVSALKARRVAAAVPRAHAPRYLEATIAALSVLLLYVITLAPTVAFWDAGEYLTAAHVLGIPHPPGNPLFVMTAHVWERVFMALGVDAAVALNLYSACLSAAAHAFWYLLTWRALQTFTDDVRVQRAGAVAAVLLSATAFTVWNQSNVNEKVYTLSLFTVALCCWLVVRWRDDGRRPAYLVAAMFTLALTSTNHLMGVLAAPALLAFVVMVDARSLLNRRLWTGAALALLIGLLPQFFLPIRAAQQPVLAETAPTCESVLSAAASVYTWGNAGCESLNSTLTREQYGKPPITLDPTVYPAEEVPRSAGLFASQILNYLQYFDWQWARSIAGNDTLFGGMRPLFTLLVILLGAYGARMHWRADRPSAALLAVLFATLSLGLVTYLNFRYGFSIARERYPSMEFHEVRERDYFFLITFSVWALWMGFALAALWQRASRHATSFVARPALATAPLLGLALLPMALNWQWASRSDDYAARDWAYSMLMSVEPYGVLFTNGDNDTFPLWYLQEVEGLRRDVTVLVTTYLNTPWYVRQARDITRSCDAGQNPLATPSRVVCQRPYDAGHVPVELAALMRTPRAPEDTILPLSDAEIDRISANGFVTREPMTFRAGGIEGTIESGTAMLPADTFVAAVLHATLGERPIHFSTPSPVIEKLGLDAYAVRHGLTFKLLDEPPGDRLQPMPTGQLSDVFGAYVDVAFTDTLLRIAPRRGRIADPDAPFVDRAVSSIVLQYAWAHYALAQSYLNLGREQRAEEHVQRAERWQSIVTED